MKMVEQKLPSREASPYPTFGKGWNHRHTKIAFSEGGMLVPRRVVQLEIIPNFEG